MATLRKITLNWEIRTGAITCDTGYIKRQELCDVDLYVTVDGTAYALDTSWALNLSIKPTLLGDNAALIAVTTWTASATTGLYQATAQTMGGTALDTYLAANNSDTTDDEGNKLVDLDVYYTISTAVKSKSDTVTLILKPDVGRADDTVPATIIARNDFLVSNGTGLLINVAAGYAANGAFVAAQASLAITNATNYIEATAAGVASVNTTAFTAGSYPLATVVASAGAITSNTDLRAWITPKPAAAGGVTSITGTANEITVTGTTTPTLSLPSGLTFTGKTITGGTFASPTITTPTIGDGTEAAPSLSFTSDTNTGVYRPAADTVGIVGGGNDVVRMTGIASATDYLEIKNGIGVGSPLHVLAEGASANIGVHLQPKGSGLLTISDGTDFNKGIRFRSSSSAASAITLLDAVSTAGRVITLPDATGTLALVSGDLGTPSALVGTNITGTASGLTAGNSTLAATVTVANEATDTTCFPLFATAATGSLAALSNAGLTFNSATRLLSATGLAGAFNGTVGATTPSTVAGTTGTFSGVVSTTGANSHFTTSGTYAQIYTTGANADIYTTGLDSEIFTTGNNGFIRTAGNFASIYTDGTNAPIYTTGTNAYIQTRSTFRLNGGTFVTTLSHAATADRAIAFPDAAGTLALVSGNLGTPSAIVLTNATGTAASLTAGTVTTNANLTGHVTSVGNAAVLGSFTMAQLSAAVSDGDPAYVGAANTFTGATNTFSNPVLSPAGTNSSPGMTFTGETNTGIYKAATGFIGLTAGSTPCLVCSSTILRTGSGFSFGWASGSAQSTGLDTILSRNAAGIVQIGTTAANALGSLLLTNLTASGTLAVTGATTLTGNLTSNGALISVPQALSGNGAVAAVNLTTLTTTIVNTGTANTTTTLAAGTNGQTKIISFITDGGFDAVITVTNPAWGGAGTITMNDALDNVMLIYLNSVWQVFINNGCTLA